MCFFANCFECLGASRSRLLREVNVITTLIFLLTFWVLPSHAKTNSLCTGVAVDGEIAPPLDALEKRLVCGDSREGWQSVPHNQAEFQLRTFLQARGYHRVKFRSQGESLLVEL